jgi:type II secretory pathway component PulJ
MRRVMTYHRARVCTSLTASSLVLASIVRLTNALQDKQTRSRVHVDKQTSRVQTASASLRVHISDSDLLSGRHEEPSGVPPRLCIFRLPECSDTVTTEELYVH